MSVTVAFERCGSFLGRSTSSRVGKIVLAKSRSPRRTAALIALRPSGTCSAGSSCLGTPPLSPRGSKRMSENHRGSAAPSAGFLFGGHGRSVGFPVRVHAAGCWREGKWRQARSRLAREASSRGHLERCAGGRSRAGRSPMRSSGRGVSSRRARESAPAWARAAAAAMLAESEHALAPAAAPGSGMQRRSYVLDQHNADQQPARTRGNPC